MSGELAYLGLAEAAELIRAKRLSPVEYVTALLARIERHDGKYNAFIALTPERALTAARAAEAEIAAGRWRGPFHGMPYALKDIIDVEGLPTTAHSKILMGNIARRHAVVTERLEAAGGVLLGKLSTHEFAIAALPSTCPGRRRATHGTAITFAAARRAAAAPASPPASSRPHSAPTPADRSATRPRCAALPG
jgi:Asp-tRNA(Asn)/Glu-tRNA(Gln) amidotransferase A subunit family amidase